MIIRILGAGCAKCEALEKEVMEAAKELNIECGIKHVDDFREIASFGVLNTPGLMINDDVVSTGTVLKKRKIIKLLEKYM